jgi:hypothetical protein
MHWDTTVHTVKVKVQQTYVSYGGEVARPSETEIPEDAVEVLCGAIVDTEEDAIWHMDRCFRCRKAGG